MMIRSPQLAAMKRVRHAFFTRAGDTVQTAYLAIAPLLLASLWKHSFMHSVELPFSPEAYIDGWLETFFNGIERPTGAAHA